MPISTFRTLELMDAALEEAVDYLKFADSGLEHAIFVLESFPCGGLVTMSIRCSGCRVRSSPRRMLAEAVESG